LALEDTPRRLHDRLEDLDRRPAEITDLDFVFELRTRMSDGGPADDGTRSVRALLRRKQYVAMIIDTLPAAFVPIIQRDVVRAQYAQSSLLRKLGQEFNIGILVVQHLRKQASDHAVDKVSGTSGVTGGLDSILTLDGQKDRVILEIVSRETDSKPIPLKLDLAQGGWITSDAGPNTSIAREEILNCLIEHGPMQPKDIAQFLNKSGDAVRQLLRRLKQAGSVEKVDSRYQAAGALEPKSCCAVSGFAKTDHSSEKVN
jgi:DNA-binding transcriptional ArsR family regulator